MEHNQLPPDSAVRPSEPQTIIQPLTPSGPEVLDLCVRRPTPPLTPRSPATPPHTPRSPLALTHEQPRFQPQAPTAHKHEQLPAAAPFSWHSPAGSPESAAAAAGRPAALWRGPSPSSTHQGLPSPPLEPVAGPSNYYVLQQQLQAPPMLPMPVAVHPLIAPPPQQLPPQLLKQRAIVACPDRYTPYSQPDLLARSPPLPLPAQSSTSPTPGSSAAGQNGPLAPAALAASASSMGFQEVGPLMLPLTPQASSGSRGGKPTRPFKAYPRDPLSFTAGMPLPDNWETSNRYQQYRMRVLASSGVANRSNGAARRAGGGAGSRRNPPAQPAQQPSSSDANNNGEENAGRPDSPRRADRAGGAGGGGGDGGGGGAGADNNGQPQQQQPQKDGAYWERRRRNNEAAKRSRDARRAKEDEVAIRAAFLEQENLQLRLENSAMRSMIQHWQQLFPHVQIVQQPMQQPQPQQQQQQQQQQQPMPSPGINPHSPQIELPAGLRPVPDCFG